jgi:DHA1 family bicyclomycin/chloramphenicol resistance-like MFS transporter
MTFFPNAPAPQRRFLKRTSPPHLMTLVLLAGVAALSMNIFLPSLPSMAVHFDTEPWLVALAVPVYLGVNAVLQLFIGPISDRYGRRPVLLWSILVFLLATLGTLAATSIEVFLIFRMGQATIVAGLVLSRAVVRDMVGPDEAASMIGYVTMGMALVPMVGPMVGGVLDQAFGWQANFWLLFGAGLLIFWLVWADLGETATATSNSFAEQVRDYPELLTSPRFWGYCTASALASGAFFAFLGGAPFVATDTFHLSPTVMGAYFGFPAMGYAVGNFISGRYSSRVGLNRMVLTGTLITCFGLSTLIILYLTITLQTTVFFAFFICIGLGNGLAIPNAMAGMLSVRPHLAGTASGLGGAIMIGGGAALSALAGSLLTPGSGPMPLLILMLLTSFASVIAVLLVIARARKIALC